MEGARGLRRHAPVGPHRERPRPAWHRSAPENVDRSWFRDVFAGEADLAYDWTDEDRDAEFKPGDDVGIAELLHAYAKETASCDAVIAAASWLDGVSAREGFSLRWIMVHMIEETGRHLGQIDLLREQADGEVGEDPPD